MGTWWDIYIRANPHLDSDLKLMTIAFSPFTFNLFTLIANIFLSLRWTGAKYFFNALYFFGGGA